MASLVGAACRDRRQGLAGQNAHPVHLETIRMKLYYSPGACSLSPHITLRESGLPFELVLASTKTHLLADGTDYYTINPKGYVPLLELDSSQLTGRGDWRDGRAARASVKAGMGGEGMGKEGRPGACAAPPRKLLVLVLPSREGAHFARLAQHLVDLGCMQLLGMDHLPRELFQRDGASFDQLKKPPVHVQRLAFGGQRFLQAVRHGMPVRI